MSDELAQISAAFAIRGTLVSIAPHGNGHINDTYVATYERAGATVRFLHQRINHRVFADPRQVMRNIQRVTAHMRDKLGGAGDELRNTLSVIPTRGGEAVLRDDAGNYWRTYRFVEGTYCREHIETADQAYQAARAFGRFQARLADLPARALVETIPDFHNTPQRWATFQRILASATDRVDRAKPEIAYAHRRQTLVHTLAQLHECGLIPERIAHNDGKINNVLFDARTDEAICVIDLDTVMPGLSLYDFGDLVRTMTCPAAEDETDLSIVEVQVPLFDAVVRGYLTATHTLLNTTEQASLISASETIIFEQGLRFLTDYLAGDVYYKTLRPEQNLDRCRTQFALLDSIDHRRQELRECVAAQFNHVHPVR